MEGKEADISNLLYVEANNIVFSMCSASKSIKELDIKHDAMEKEDDMSILAPMVANENALRTYSTFKSINVLGTKRELNQNKEDLNPVVYLSPLSFVEPSIQETQPSNTSFGKKGGKHKAIWAKC
ncbi:hypothetical protein V6N12_043404 [Hibiscus sabdariffa]|uniref:Uncharacterized protein n=1 Tax=Hibiscus sabdariffa TaxID=183260 RepID=A0ABR2DF86_9ROSI